MKVFQILSHILMIVTYVGTGFTLVTGSFSLTGFIRADNLVLRLLTDTTATTPVQFAWILIATAIYMLFGSILTTYVYRYFTAELIEETPFTDKEADRIKQLGIMMIRYGAELERNQGK